MNAKDIIIGEVYVPRLRKGRSIASTPWKGGPRLVKVVGRDRGTGEWEVKWLNGLLTPYSDTFYLTSREISHPGDTEVAKIRDEWKGEAILAEKRNRQSVAFNRLLDAGFTASRGLSIAPNFASSAQANEWEPTVSITLHLGEVEALLNRLADKEVV